MYAAFFNYLVHNFRLYLDAISAFLLDRRQKIASMLNRNSAEFTKISNWKSLV